MHHPTIASGLLKRYLNLLGIQKRKPGAEALFELVQAHLVTVPFENISKLFYKKHHSLHGLPGLELFLDGIEHFHFGGTCYSNNYYFYLLLANLGYRIKLCGADMSAPNVHMVSLVKVAQQEYLIDVGYGAPFLSPIPRDLATDYTIVLGRDHYVFKPQDERGGSRMELFRNGSLVHSYTVNPMARQIHEFHQIIADSFREDSTFMKAVLLARFFPKRSIVIHNLTLIESEGTVSNIQYLNSRDEMVKAAHEYFGIPKEFTLDLVREIGQFGDAWH